MVHDGQGHSSCGDVRGTIMSPSLSGLDSTFLWSSCSQRDLANFLRSPRALCLNNIPVASGQLKFPDILPGQLYDGNTQCMFQFGSRSRLCRHYAMTDEICNALWCENGRKCETKFLPAAEGTLCGNNKWCRKGECILQKTKNLNPVHGGWSNFTQWSSCSVMCGHGGLKQRERKCDLPSPKNDGHYCKGAAREFSICSEQRCVEQDIKKDEDYCVIFNHRRVKGKYYKWKPYNKDLGALARCRIYCTPSAEDMHVALSTKLPDGISCQGNYSSVCVDGECRSVGCDGRIDSDLLPDNCGVCNGDNSTCTIESGSYVAKNISQGYNEVIKIPKGSRHINISETADYPTFLSIRPIKGPSYINGNWAIHWPGRYMAGDVVFSYRRWPGRPESLIAKGPTNEELIVEVLAQERQYSAIKYSFVVPVPSTKWQYFNSSCSGTCGKGNITSIPNCTNTQGKIISSKKCHFKMPVSVLYSCYQHCPPKWTVSRWSRCSPDGCDMVSFKTRDVYCVVNNKTIDAWFCRSLKKPTSTHKCHKNKCNGIWIATQWSTCSVSCGRGTQSRNVTCVSQHKIDSTHYKFSAFCDENKRPNITSACMGIACQGCEDRKRWCKTLVNYESCRKRTYVKNCCRSCSVLQ